MKLHLVLLVATATFASCKKEHAEIKEDQASQAETHSTFANAHDLSGKLGITDSGIVNGPQSYILGHEKAKALKTLQLALAPLGGVAKLLDQQAFADIEQTMATLQKGGDAAIQIVKEDVQPADLEAQLAQSQWGVIDPGVAKRYAQFLDALQGIPQPASIDVKQRFGEEKYQKALKEFPDLQASMPGVGAHRLLFRSLVSESHNSNFTASTLIIIIEVNEDQIYIVPAEDGPLGWDKRKSYLMMSVPVIGSFAG